MAITVVKVEDLESYVGKELGATDWFKIDQERINKFADATLDHQFIHVDPEQATPIFGSTIAHGFLTLSLTAGIGQDIALVVEGAKMGLNYGLDKVRFPNATKAGSKFRGRVSLADFKVIANGAKYKLNVIIELEGHEKPACVAEFLALAYN